MFSRHLLFLLRQLAKRRGLTIAIVLITAAGIAVNAAVFSVVYAVLLKPLPYPEAQQLLFISGTSGTGERMPVSLPDFRDWRTQQHTFEDLAAYNVEDFSLLLNGDPALRRRIRFSQVFSDPRLTPQDWALVSG